MIRLGVRPDGERMSPPMPYSHFALMTDNASPPLSSTCGNCLCRPRRMIGRLAGRIMERPGGHLSLFFLSVPRFFFFFFYFLCLDFFFFFCLVFFIFLCLFRFFFVCVFLCAPC
jgi:hypothetical protein